MSRAGSAPRPSAWRGAGLSSPPPTCVPGRSPGPGSRRSQRAVAIDFSLCDMRSAYAHHRRQFDVVVSCDNSITHLLNDDDLLLASGRFMTALDRVGAAS